MMMIVRIIYKQFAIVFGQVKFFFTKYIKKVDLAARSEYFVLC